jgi:hypothetical protein
MEADWVSVFGQTYRQLFGWQLGKNMAEDVVQHQGYNDVFFVLPEV